jgi:ATP-dependent 26S proteasome regulatory subunit
MKEPSLLADEACWQQANLEHLQGHLLRLRLLLQCHIGWLRARWQRKRGADSDLAPGLAITDAAADLLLLEDDIADRHAFFATDPHVAAISARLADLGPLLDHEAATMAEAGRPPALDVLCRLFGLNAFERDVLLLCAAAEMDQAFPRLYAYVQDDVQLRHATIPLALRLFCDTDVVAHVARRCFAPEAPVRRYALLTTPAEEGVQCLRPIRIDDRVLDYLGGRDRMDERAADVLHPTSPGALSPEQQRAVAQLLGVLQAPGPRPRYGGVNLFGPPGSGRRAVARELCSRLGLGLYSLAGSRLPAGAAERQALLRLLGREAVLSRFAIYVRLEELEGADAALATDVLDRLPVFYVVGSRGRPATRRELLAKKLSPLNPGARADLWNGALSAAGADLNGSSAAVAEHFPFGQDLIARTVSAACARARMRDAGASVTEDDIWEACREQASWDLRQLAQQVEPAFTWDDIVLPAEVLGALHEIAAQVAHRAKVYRQWGFAARAGRGLGISALFAGVSGTGKTMAAEVLARHLRLDLYRIDLAGVVSKYIGETEKNLKKIFDAAERCGAILFFDEADALFGKRTEVKDSHDRFANIEVNYLLQRMEHFSGLSILATNRKSDLDRAFLRRLRFLVDFPFPDAMQRMRIWQKSFPPGAPLEDLDFDALARLEIAGGNIRNIALAAAFLAAERNVPIGMKLLLQAARREYAKMEIMMGETEGRPAWK